MIQAKTPKQRRKESKPAEIVQAKPRPRLANSVKRLQWQAPLLAVQGLSKLSARLRQGTEREIIAMNRDMEFSQFVYKQQGPAPPGANTGAASSAPLPPDPQPFLPA